MSRSRPKTVKKLLKKEQDKPLVAGSPDNFVWDRLPNKADCIHLKRISLDGILKKMNQIVMNYFTPYINKRKITSIERQAIIGALDTLLETHPKNPDVKLLCAIFFARDGKVDHALDEYKIMANEHPTFWKCYYYHANLLHHDRPTRENLELALNVMEPIFFSQQQLSDKAQPTKQIYNTALILWTQINDYLTETYGQLLGSPSSPRSQTQTTSPAEVCSEDKEVVGKEVEQQIDAPREDVPTPPTLKKEYVSQKSEKVESGEETLKTQFMATSHPDGLYRLFGSKITKPNIFAKREYIAPIGTGRPMK